MMPRERLTPKEIQVATLVWEGLTNVASQFFLSAEFRSFQPFSE